ncbi:SIS domain-containing protein [uncultured Mitsuokella sp.]|uniref:D-sedoheptulose-7-phosphate isomerase n=1 Tax=uncultured Mitsuokella sp. TaxID=453120 RepID=UPI00261397D1|nr:SIS domain-containing protein [uncultured Mitsuokella sp.]
MHYETDIRAYLKQEMTVLEKLDIAAIDAVISCLKQAFFEEKTIYICGNGGSASTASHVQNDFNKGISEYTNKKFRVCCLNDNVATLMAIANDIDFAEVFRFQLQGRLQPGDILIAISGSGNSENILRAVKYAKACGNTVIGVTGFDGGNLRPLADLSLHAPVMSMQITEDVHMIFNHLIMAIFYRELCGKNHMKSV